MRSLLCAAVGAAMLLSGAACKSGPKGPPAPWGRPSPDKTMLVRGFVNTESNDPATVNRVAFEVRDAQTGRVVYTGQSAIAADGPWGVQWIDDNTLRVEGERGAQVFVRGPDGTWGPAR